MAFPVYVAHGCVVAGQLGLLIPKTFGDQRGYKLSFQPESGRVFWREVDQLKSVPGLAELTVSADVFLFYRIFPFSRSADARNRRRDLSGKGMDLLPVGLQRLQFIGRHIVKIVSLDWEIAIIIGGDPLISPVQVVVIYQQQMFDLFKKVRRAKRLLRKVGDAHSRYGQIFFGDKVCRFISGTLFPYHAGRFKLGFRFRAAINDDDVRLLPGVRRIAKNTLLDNSACDALLKVEFLHVVK